MYQIKKNKLSNKSAYIVMFVIIYAVTMSFGCAKMSDVSENVILIELPDAYEEEYIIENPLFVSLETKDDVLLGWLNIMKIFNDTIYILDNSKIYLFDINGKYLNRLDKQGYGPFEYLRIDDFDIFEDNIYVLTPNKIIVYNKYNFQAIEENEIDYYAHSLFVGEENIVLNTNSFRSGYILNYLSRTSGKNTKRLQSEIKSGDTGMTLTLSGYKFNKMPNVNSALFYKTFSDFIYTVTDTGYQCAYQIDLKGKGIPKSILAKNPQAIWEYINSNKHKYVNEAFQIGNTIAISISSNYDYRLGDDPYLIKTMNRTAYHRAIIDGDLGLNVRIAGTSSMGFIGIINSEVLLKRKNELLKKDEHGIELNLHERKFVESFDGTPNPYLVFFNF